MQLVSTPVSPPHVYSEEHVEAKEADDDVFHDCDNVEGPVPEGQGHVDDVCGASSDRVSVPNKQTTIKEVVGLQVDSIISASLDGVTIKVNEAPAVEVNVSSAGTEDNEGASIEKAEDIQPDAVTFCAEKLRNWSEESSQDIGKDI